MKVLHIIMLLGIGAILVLLAGCSLPCTYQGKAVPRADAERMRTIGLDVTCP